MKIRAFFLCSCMTVVPLTALLSHRLPGGVVQAAGGVLTALLGESEPDNETPVDRAGESPLVPVSVTLPAAARATAPPAVGVPAQVDQPAVGVPAQVDQPAVGVPAHVNPQAPVQPLHASLTEPGAGSAMVMQVGGNGADAAAAGIRQHIAALGGVGLECRPQPGEGEGHGFLATCRVALDAEGSLFRMFQSAGGDPVSACHGLLETVETWRRTGGVRTARTTRTGQAER